MVLDYICGAVQCQDDAVTVLTHKQCSSCRRRRRRMQGVFSYYICRIKSINICLASHGEASGNTLQTD